MRILLSLSDRDLLSAYESLLSLDGDEAVTAFDGAQAASKLAEGGIELAVLDSALSRIDIGRIVRMLHEENIPSVVALRGRLNTALLLQNEPANAYITFPFQPAELRAAMTDVAKKASGNEITVFDDVEIDEWRFLLCGRARVTAGEIDVFSSLICGEAPEKRHLSAYVGALNNKFERLGKKTRIVYSPGRGYGMVTLHE
ncbi:MAG: response regulator transcription factor [Clostridia bacterium]|nr:response regulator transcription factor [Clostridia bacterium]